MIQNETRELHLLREWYAQEWKIYMKVEQGRAEYPTCDLCAKIPLHPSTMLKCTQISTLIHLVLAKGRLEMGIMAEEVQMAYYDPNNNNDNGNLLFRFDFNYSCKPL